MYCILNSAFALRSWRRVPYAMIRRGAVKPMPVDEDTFRILECSDGSTDIPDSRRLQELLQAGIIRRCAQGQAELSDWQRWRRYGNRCFPAVCWSITERCSFNCRHCFVGVGPDREAPGFSWSEAVDFLRAAEKCGVQAVALTGGEPLMHPAFWDILMEIGRRGMHVFMINTNGVLITPDWLRRMRSVGCVPLLRISFDGIGHHDWLRGRPGAERMAKEAIELCVAERFPVMVQMNVHPGNVHCIDETLAYLESVGVPEVRLIRTADTPKWQAGGHGAVMSFTEYFDRMLRVVESFCRQERRIALDIWRFVRLVPRERQYRITAIRHGCRDFSDRLPVCEGNRNMISVAADGELYPCHSFSGYCRQKGVSLGNVKRQPLGELLSGGDYMDRVCETVGELATRNHRCGRCSFLRYCCGGCRAMATLYGGDYDAVDPMMCTFFEGRYDLKLRAALADWRDELPEELPDA